MASKLKPTTIEALSGNGSLPKGWRMVRFGDVVRDVNEAERNPLEAGLERFVGLEHIEPENLHLKQWGLLADGEISFTKRFRKGQVLFGKRRAYQRKVAVAEFGGICSSDILTFEPKANDLLPELLPFIVQSEGFFEHALGTSSGSLSPRTRWSQLQDYEFPLPPKDEQRRIAEILLAADNATESFNTSRISAETLYTTLVGTIYSEGLSHKGSRASELGPIPKDWQIARLESLCDQTAPIGYGIVQSGAHDELGVPTLNIKDLHGDQFTGVHRTSATIEKGYARSRVKGGDLLLSIKATVGEVDIVVDNFCGNISRDLARIRTNERVLPRFLLHLFRSARYQAYIHRYVVGSTRKEISIHYLRRFLIPHPESNEQLRVVRILDAALDNINKLIAHEAQSQHVKMQLLNSLLRRE